MAGRFSPARQAAWPAGECPIPAGYVEQKAAPVQAEPAAAVEE